MTAVELQYEAARRGLRLEPAGDKLAVIPAKRCPPEFADVLRQHKVALLNLLEGQAAGLAPDCAPWLPIAKQVLAGEFEGGDSSTVQSLIIGLRGIRHPLWQQALARLDKHQTRSSHH
jgi:hypothetical protein